MPTHTLRPTGIGMAVLGGVLAIVGVLAGGSAKAGLLIGALALLGAGVFVLWVGQGWEEPPEDDQAEGPGGDRARR